MPETLGSLTTTLLDELARTGQLTSQAHTYINRSILHYRSKAFWFNEGTEVITCSAGQEYYDLTTDFGMAYDAKLTIKTDNYDTSDTLSVASTSLNTYPLERRTLERMNRLYIHAENYTGYPQDYAVFNQQLRLGPIPADTYEVEVYYKRMSPSLGGTGSTNAVIQNAEDLILARAGKLMSTIILQDDKRAASFHGLEQEAKAAHASITAQYLMTGYTKRRRIAGQRDF